MQNIITITRCAMPRRDIIRSYLHAGTSSYNIQAIAMRKISNALPHIEVPVFQTGASPINGTVVVPPPGLTPVPLTPVPLAPVPLAPVPVGAGKAVELFGTVKGNPIGLALGVIVVLPMTIIGAVAETATGVSVDDPLRVAVKVVKTSDNVVVFNGSFDVGFVVGARVVDIAAKATPV